MSKWGLGHRPVSLLDRTALNSRACKLDACVQLDWHARESSTTMATRVLLDSHARESPTTMASTTKTTFEYLVLFSSAPTHHGANLLSCFQGFHF